MELWYPNIKLGSFVSGIFKLNFELSCIFEQSIEKNTKLAYKYPNRMKMEYKIKTAFKNKP